jgi:hypothetical protein
MRTLSILLILPLFVGVAFAVRGNPQPGQEQVMCLLSSLAFSDDITLNSEFVSTTFIYEATCPPAKQSTFITPFLMDESSTAEVYFNDQPINTRPLHNAISNSGKVEYSPNHQSDSITLVPGLNKFTIGVSCNGLGDPPCYYYYNVTCNRQPDQGGSVVGDPQFSGLRGQNFQVHGVSGEIYNIVSEPQLQYNARFVFLSAGKCPNIDGVRAKGCFSHPGSYLGELGLKTVSGDRIRVLAGSAESGYASITVNNKELAVGDSISLRDDLGSVSYNSTHLVTVTVGIWTFEFENSDMFVNQRVAVRGDLAYMTAHGLLGQTWRTTTYRNAVKYIQGQVDDYVIREKDIFGDSFIYNNFN